MKRLIAKFLDLFPPLHRYFNEKYEMGRKIDEQSSEINELEHRNLELNRELRKIKDFVVPQVKFVAHQLDITGAPLIFMEIVRDFIAQHPDLPVEFHSYEPVNPDNLSSLIGMGLQPVIHESKDEVPNFVMGDVVVLNTSAFSLAFKEAIFSSLENNIIKKVIWYIHENDLEFFFSKQDKEIINQLLHQGKIIMFSAANKAVQDCQTFFDDEKNIKKQTYKLIYPNKYHRQISPQDFNKLSFILVGLAANGRKGQLPILYAFLEFKSRFFDVNPSLYRDFDLKYIGITDMDYVSRQILLHSPGLGRHFKHYPTVAHDKAMEIIKNANITICYSINECLPIFVYEGMITGHPILRNDCSGMEEQLIDGKNGFYLDSHSFDQVVQTIERMLNKEKTTNQQLSGMSKAAYNLALEQSKASFKPIISEIKQAYLTRGTQP